MASTTAAVLVGALLAPAVLFAATPLGIQVEASYTTDDNVSRAADAFKLSDWSYSIKLSKNMDFPISSSTRLRLLGFLGDEQFNTYTGLSHYFFGIRGELQYRDDSEFDSPTFGVFARTSKDEYESYLRDSYRYSVGITVSRPLTESMQVYAALTRNVRDSNSAVFDTQEWSGRLNVDYALSRNSTLYVAGEYHRGDTVSSAPLSLAYLDIAEAVVRDDVFPGRIAYRVHARTAIATVGYNLAFSDKQALDISGRWVQATPTATPGYPVPGNTLRYVDKQFTVAYLIRF